MIVIENLNNYSFLLIRIILKFNFNIYYYKTNLKKRTLKKYKNLYPIKFTKCKKCLSLFRNANLEIKNIYKNSPKNT